ncbi:hypothetical protein Syun_000839 [Stephania yunnanensis]|uniref:F-box domain-containing protein n=1 Tax=Stephania yunnanensis TaxID=152371 RepID=A0AAP0Q757_9MAGN
MPRVRKLLKDIDPNIVNRYADVFVLEKLPIKQSNTSSVRQQRLILVDEDVKARIEVELTDESGALKVVASGSIAEDIISLNAQEIMTKTMAYEETEKRREMAKNSLERYTHYYERWMTNQYSNVVNMAIPLFQSLPSDVIVHILAKLGETSLKDFFSASLTSKSINSLSENDKIYQCLDLTTVVLNTNDSFFLSQHHVQMIDF